ncbi:MAG: acyl carrier protein, partial [Gammaproteobacteria bacterium]|nr:acyl carrier protein [Gammaproteobacteria bacterium]
DIKNKIFKAFENIDIENAKMSSYLEQNLGMDSQEIIMLMVELEKAFNIELEEKDIDRKMKVDDVITLINNKLSYNNGVNGDVKNV